VHIALPTRMMMSDAFRVALRPKTSAICAQKGMKEAEVKLKAAAIQLSCDIRPKSAAIHGKALAIL
jgi:hypothetical protein